MRVARVLKCKSVQADDDMSRHQVRSRDSDSRVSFGGFELV